MLVDRNQGYVVESEIINGLNRLGVWCEPNEKSFRGQHINVKTSNQPSITSDLVSRFYPDAEMYHPLDKQNGLLEIKSGHYMERESYRVCKHLNEQCPVYICYGINKTSFNLMPFDDIKVKRPLSGDFFPPSPNSTSGTWFVQIGVKRFDSVITITKRNNKWSWSHSIMAKQYKLFK